MKRYAYMNKNGLEYYNNVRSNATMCEERHDCEGMENVFASIESETSVFERRFLQGCMATERTKGIVLIVMKGKRSCVHPGYLRKPPDNVYCSALKL
jgi:hypothetical protein